MSLTDLLLGRPLATREEGAERIGPAAGIPIFGLDALSSAAYGPEAALTLLIPLGLAPARRSAAVDLEGVQVEHKDMLIYGIRSPHRSTGEMHDGSLVNLQP